MKLYFVDKEVANIQLVDGRIVVTGREADQIREVLVGYRRIYGPDEEIYRRLPKLFRGYWHIDETS